MPHSTLDPVFTGLRFGLHALLIALAGFAVVRAFVVSSPAAGWTLFIGIAFVAVYLIGALTARAHAGSGAPGVRSRSAGSPLSRCCGRC